MVLSTVVDAGRPESGFQFRGGRHVEPVIEGGEWNGVRRISAYEQESSYPLLVVGRRQIFDLHGTY